MSQTEVFEPFFSDKDIFEKYKNIRLCQMV